MLTSNLVALAASLSTASAAALQGFNYGSTFTDGSAKMQSDYQSDFSTAKNLVGTSGFTSARLYTMIQAGTTNTYIEAIPAAIAEGVTLLLGMWASGGQANFQNELTALTTAINSLGASFGSAVAGISVGSEDLYRNSPIGIAGNDGIGANPDTLTGYISQVRSAIAGTALRGVPVGHVDTWTAWVNGSNDAVIAASDFIGMDAYPYFQNTMDNSIQNSKATFFEAYYNTTAAAGSKPVWITETGWPVSGPTENLAVPSLANAQTYWDEVACAVLGKINTYWYTLQDAAPVTPSPSFGLVGSVLSTTPLYNLTCPAAESIISSSASSSAITAISAKTSVASAAGASFIASQQSGVVSMDGSGPIVATADSTAAKGSLSPSASTVAPVPVSTTVYTTEVVKVTSCGPAVTSCPASIMTTTYAVSTTIYTSSSTAVVVAGATGASSAGASFVTTATPVGNSTLTTGVPSAPLSTFTGGAGATFSSVGGALAIVLAFFAAL